MRFLLEHKFPKKFRYAKVYMQAGAASLFFKLDGTSADWHASIGKSRNGVEMTDREYSALREAVPAVELLDDDGRSFIVRNAQGSEEQWEKPRWVLQRVHKKQDTNP